MDRNTVKDLRKAVDAALEAVGKEFNMSISVGRISYDQSNATLQVKASMIGEGGVVQTQERTDFIALAKYHGLDPKWIDKEFTSRGDTFVLSGLKTRSPKYPVLARNTKTGKMFKFAANDVTRRMIASGYSLEAV